MAPFARDISRPAIGVTWVRSSRRRYTPQTAARAGRWPQEWKVGLFAAARFKPESVGLKPGVNREQNAEQDGVNGDHGDPVGTDRGHVGLENAAIPAAGEPASEANR